MGINDNTKEIILDGDEGEEMGNQSLNSYFELLHRML